MVGLHCRSACKDEEFEALVQRNMAANAGLNFAGGVFHVQKPLPALRQRLLFCMEALRALRLHISLLKLAVCRSVVLVILKENWDGEGIKATM